MKNVGQLLSDTHTDVFQLTEKAFIKVKATAYKTLNINVGVVEEYT